MKRTLVSYSAFCAKLAYFSDTKKLSNNIPAPSRTREHGETSDGRPYRRGDCRIQKCIWCSAHGRQIWDIPCLLLQFDPFQGFGLRQAEFRYIELPYSLPCLF